jgi:hypothetical protein
MLRGFPKNIPNSILISCGFPSFYDSRHLLSYSDSATVHLVEFFLVSHVSHIIFVSLAFDRFDSSHIMIVQQKL